MARSCRWFAILLAIGAALAPWSRPPATEARTMQPPAFQPNYDESKVPRYLLPDPLLCADGTRIATTEAWERKGRPETLDRFAFWVYGRALPTAEVQIAEIERDPQALGGRAIRKRARITATADGRSFAFEATLLLPADARRVPAFLLINIRREGDGAGTGYWPVETILARGYAAATFRTWDVDPDERDPAARARGVRGIWPAGGGREGFDAWGTLAAWAWGASRVLDYLLTDPAIDPERIAVIGHSRGGKTALWAGAQDPRFALVISNESGCGGAALSRRRFGETVARINTVFPYWFCDNFKRFNDREDDLPVDQHQLVALVAPRAVYVASAEEDRWADPRGEFLALAHASPVYALYGEPGIRPEEMPPVDTPLHRGRMAYHLRRGAHALTEYDWERYLDFADSLWRRRPAE